MYAIVAGGGKVGASITRSLLAMGHEVTLIEQRRDRFEQLEAELGPVILAGDATELHILERAGIARPPDIVLAVTGDDEDNIVIAQIAQDGYQVPKVIARVNDPRNQEHFDLLGVNADAVRDVGPARPRRARGARARPRQAARAETRGPGGRRVAGVARGLRPPASGVAGLALPTDIRLVSITRNGVAEVAGLDTVIRPGDQVIAILKPRSRGRSSASALVVAGSDAPVAARQRARATGIDLEAAEPHEDRSS